MQSARPRISICPMQIGLGVQLHHHFASKFKVLIDTLYSFGFCSSYAEVQIFQYSAAVTQGTDILGFTPGRFIQFVADNVDHNIRTLDGLNTFHGMRIIAGLTPASDQSSQVIRATVSTDELVLAGKVASSANSDIEPLKYKEIKELKVMDNTWKLDLLLNVIWPLRSPMPMWSGLMQMHQKGVYPGKSSFTFFPMIDLDPGDLTCIFSTLHFVTGIAERYGTKAVITFDQPLYWKAMKIISIESSTSPPRQIVLRLGGFHTIMSFLGSIGHLMAGAGLQEVLETLYASQAVNHMLSGKAVERALRGHLLVEKALYALIISNHTGMDLPVMKQDVDQNATSREANERCENSTSIPADFGVALSLFEDLLNEKASVFDM